MISGLTIKIKHLQSSILAGFSNCFKHIRAHLKIWACFLQQSSTFQPPSDPRESHNCCSISAPSSVDVNTLWHHSQSLHSQNRWLLAISTHQTLTYMSKFLHAVLHGSGKSLFYSLSSWCLVAVRGDGAAGRRPTGWCETDRGEDARLAAARGGDSPAFFGYWDGGTTLRSWVTRTKKVRWGLPPLTHYTPSTSSSVRVR